MSTVCEDAAPGSGSVFDIINNFACELTTLIYNTLGITSNVNNLKPEEDILAQKQQTLLELYQEFSAWLAFDEFQLQLFKVFAFILVSNVALIYVAWHVYGARISDRFMKPGEQFRTFILLITSVIVFSFYFTYLHQRKNNSLSSLTYVGLVNYSIIV